MRHFFRSIFIPQVHHRHFLHSRIKCGSSNGLNSGDENKSHSVWFYAFPGSREQTNCENSSNGRPKALQTAPTIEDKQYKNRGTRIISSRARSLYKLILPQSLSFLHGLVAVAGFWLLRPSRIYELTLAGSFVYISLPIFLPPLASVTHNSMWKKRSHSSSL